VKVRKSDPGTRTQLSRREFVAQGALYGGTFLMLWNVARPLALRAAEQSTEPAMLNDTDWRTVEAITGRIIPTDSDPGAIEANCVNFIDKALAHEDAALWPVYQAGLSGVDAVSGQRFSLPFVELTHDQQDAVLIAIQDGDADGWTDTSVQPIEFFEAIRAHTIIGFLADPKYGGNRDYTGWKLVGYPGSRHGQGGYTTAQMLSEESVQAIWGENI